MLDWRPVLLVVALVLLLSACAPDRNNPPEAAQAAQLPAFTQDPASTKGEAPATPSNVAPLDSTAFPQDPPGTCPVTTPTDPPFAPPQPYSPDGPFPSQFWYGTETLWTAIPTDGVWSALPHLTTY